MCIKSSNKNNAQSLHELRYSDRVCPLQVPYYGETGLNAGVMHMNLTRLRRYPGGWVDATMQAYDTFKQDIVLADQDILNIVFSEVSSNARGPWLK